MPTGYKQKATYAFGAELQTLRVTLDATAVTQLFSNPLTLVPAVPDHTILPLFAVLEKDAGGAFTVGSATSVGVHWAALNFPFPLNVHLSGPTVATELLQAAGGAVIVVNIGPLVNGANTWTALTGTDRAGSALVMSLTTADMTPGGGAPWHLYLEYVVLKNTGW